MREYATPLSVAIPTTGNLTDDVVGNGTHHPHAVVLSRRDPEAEGGWRDVDAGAFLAEVRGVAKGLVAAGIEPGDRVLLLSRTRYEWTLIDYAIWFAGAVTVPVYETSAAQEVAWILADSGARAALVETDEHTARIQAAGVAADRAERTDRHLPVWTIDDDAVGVLTRLGEDVSDRLLEERRTTAGPDSLATLIYTSGTTGRPKGCRLTHGNFGVELATTISELDGLFGGPEASTVLFLPLAHVLARVIQVGCVRARVRMGHTSDIKNLLTDLAAFQPTFVLAVPRIFEKIFNTASQQALADGRGRVFDRAVGTAISYSRALETGGPGPVLRSRHAVFERLVYRRLRADLGGRCAYAVSGGAPLGERLGHFYRGIGVRILEGYGLTESCAALTVNLPDAQKVGTVGRPVEGTAVRVAEDGELLFRGGQVFSGYWGDDEATAEVLDPDGWLHSGDVGEIDDEGFVRVTGRKKEILVTAGGKNVSPGALEDRLRAHPLVDQCLVVGDGRPFVAALITLDPETYPAWAAAHGRRDDLRSLVEDPELLADLQHGVDEANRAVSKAEAIRKFTVLPAAWTEETGQLTPSLKLKRTVVTRESRDDVEALYRP